MPFQWHTHPDVSPFVPLVHPGIPIGASLQSRYQGGLLPRQETHLEDVSRPPESMQVDDSNATHREASSSAAASYSQASQLARSGEAGPSGETSYDATMTELSARRPARKHADAPMRKLSVSLIDTYKLINQVRWTAVGLHVCVCICR